MRKTDIRWFDDWYAITEVAPGLFGIGEPKYLSIGNWWPVGHRIDLGGKELEIVATPGHSPESISLLDRDAGILLAADFLYPGDLYGQVPGASLPHYLSTTETLLRDLPADLAILGAHGEEGGDDAQLPVLDRQDLVDLTAVLSSIRDTDLPLPDQTAERYRVNGRLALLASPESLGSWRAKSS